MKKPLISIICALAEDRGIGKDNKLLAYLPSDLKHFKKITKGHVVIMGQNTYQSIGFSLPERINIILSLDPHFQAPHCFVFNSLKKALDFAQKKESEEIFFIGGASVYKQAIKFADKLYLTLIKKVFPADTYFPDYSDFKKIIKEEGPFQENGLEYKFVELIK